MNSDNLIFKKLLSLNLPTQDYVIFGSAPMFAHNLKDIDHDIDIVARGAAWEKAQTFSAAQTAPLGDELVSLFGGELEIFNGWTPGVWDINELIDKADVFEGIRFVTLENVLKWKRLKAREKDFEHIKLIESYLATKLK